MTYPISIPRMVVRISARSAALTIPNMLDNLSMATSTKRKRSKYMLWNKSRVLKHMLMVTSICLTHLMIALVLIANRLMSKSSTKMTIISYLSTKDRTSPMCNLLSTLRDRNNKDYLGWQGNQGRHAELCFITNVCQNREGLWERWMSWSMGYIGQYWQLWCYERRYVVWGL